MQEVGQSRDIYSGKPGPTYVDQWLFKVCCVLRLIVVLPSKYNGMGDLCVFLFFFSPGSGGALWRSFRTTLAPHGSIWPAALTKKKCSWIFSAQINWRISSGRPCVDSLAWQWVNSFCQHPHLNEKKLTRAVHLYMFPDMPIILRHSWEGSEEGIK